MSFKGLRVDEEEEEPSFQPFRGIRNRLAARKEEAEKRRLARLLSATKAEPSHDFRSAAEKASQATLDVTTALEQAIRECEAAIEVRDTEKAAQLSAEIGVLAQKTYGLAQKAVDIATLEAKKREKDRILQKHNSIDEKESVEEGGDEEESEESEDDELAAKSPRSGQPGPIAYKKGTSVKERIDADEATRRRMELKIRTRKLLEKRKSNKSENFDINRGIPTSPIIAKAGIPEDTDADDEDPFNPIGDID